MKKEFVPCEQALALKELGFDEPCFGFYIAGHLMVTTDSVYNSTDIPVLKAPTYSQAFRWFREKYLDILVKDYGLIPHFTIIQNMFLDSDKIWTYEEAELECLRKLIEIVKNLK